MMQKKEIWYLDSKSQHSDMFQVHADMQKKMKQIRHYTNLCHEKMRLEKNQKKKRNKFNDIENFTSFNKQHSYIEFVI